MRRFLLILTALSIAAWSQPALQQALLMPPSSLPQTLVDWAQVVLVIVTVATLIVLCIYTKATVDLRKATRDQVDVSNRLLREAQAQNEASIRPILQLVATVTDETNTTITTEFQLRNLGSGPGFNVTIEPVRCTHSVYLFRHPDTLAPDDTASVDPLRTATSASLTPTEWNALFNDTQVGSSSDRPVNITIRYQNAAGKAYFTHHVITIEKDNPVPIIRLLESGPQK